MPLLNMKTTVNAQIYLLNTVEYQLKGLPTNHESIKYMQTIFFLKIVETKKQ